MIGLPNKETLRLRQARSEHPYGRVEEDGVFPGGAVIIGAGRFVTVLPLDVLRPKSDTERLAHTRPVQL